ncbi:MAG TPA: hypothetical protein VM695_04610 [Phycisphaerae bacterium]|nr:hypothetical protein [Phycisphaerae bacterium]
MRTIILAFAVAALAPLGLGSEPAGDAKAQPGAKPNKAAKAHKAAKPDRPARPDKPDRPDKAAKPVEDLAKGPVDPYESVQERSRFFKVAGVDNELDKKEFEAARGKPDSFVRSFDRWEGLLPYDKNSNATIDWFEAEAYRKAVRERVLKAFDANKDGKLAEDEREKVNRLLASGRLPEEPRADRGGGDRRRGEGPPRDRGRDGEVRGHGSEEGRGGEGHGPAPAPQGEDREARHRPQR